MTTDTTPVHLADSINARILAVSEDKIQGYQRDPISEIARQSGIDAATVRQRIAAMLASGTIRRVRQTLLATNLAHGALVAWQVPEEKLTAAFEWMFQHDPFSGHVVIRSTDAAIAGAKYRLWTTVKVPQGYWMEKRCRLLREKTGAQTLQLRPADRRLPRAVCHVRPR